MGLGEVETWQAAVWRAVIASTPGAEHQVHWLNRALHQLKSGERITTLAPRLARWGKQAREFMKVSADLAADKTLDLFPEVNVPQNLLECLKADPWHTLLWRDQNPGKLNQARLHYGQNAWSFLFFALLRLIQNESIEGKRR